MATELWKILKITFSFSWGNKSRNSDFFHFHIILSSFFLPGNGMRSIKTLNYFFILEQKLKYDNLSCVYDNGLIINWWGKLSVSHNKKRHNLFMSSTDSSRWKVQYHRNWSISHYFYILSTNTICVTECARSPRGFSCLPSLLNLSVFMNGSFIVSICVH
jgi:hypothetical protein